MNRSTTRTTVLAGLAIFLLAPIANGQSRPSLRVNVPFGFKAAGKDLPAGTYLFGKDNNGSISLSSADRVINLRMPVITSLARSSAGDDHLLAFDKVGDARVLSEVWLPGQDGVLVHSEPGEHKHELVRLVAKSK